MAKLQRGTDPAELVRRAMKRIEAGETEIRPGLSNVLKIASRLAPALIFNQMSSLSKLGHKAG